uniref:Uncharacterized protein n=1 Tax=Mimivirus LCMiAC01 TaxID=2506608 RepID=A0A481Z0X0_9VIRU|nr:MAG: hypothetical protein LCMiAC01_04930 [Mimivirus LCMiAC01]
MNTKTLQYKIHKYQWKLEHNNDLNKTHTYDKKLKYYNRLRQHGGYCKEKLCFSSQQAPRIVKKNLNSSSQQHGGNDIELKSITGLESKIKEYESMIQQLLNVGKKCESDKQKLIKKHEFDKQELTKKHEQKFRKCIAIGDESQKRLADYKASLASCKELYKVQTGIKL